MNSAQRKQFKKRNKKVAERYVKAIDEVIARYGEDGEVITVADLKYIRDEIKELV